MASTAARWAALDHRAPRNLPGPMGTLSPVTWRTTTPILVLSVRIALAADLTADPSTWSWLDITDRVRHTEGITYSDGRRDESSRVTTGSMRLTLDNAGGVFSRRNPKSPYYGMLSKNTPIWVCADPGDGMHTIAEMFVNEWPVRWDRSGNDSTTIIACSGVLRRLI